MRRQLVGIWECDSMGSFLERALLSAAYNDQRIAKRRMQRLGQLQITYSEGCTALEGYGADLARCLEPKFKFTDLKMSCKCNRILRLRDPPQLCPRPVVSVHV